MQARRLLECLETIRWAPPTLAQALHIEPVIVERWIKRQEEIPTRVASWLEALTFTHEASNLMRPSLEMTEHVIAPSTLGVRAEHVPTYSYGLLRQLSEGPVALRHLFGTDDEGAVFFLVSRGLAERRNNLLAITEMGRDLGQIAAPSGPVSMR